jgi:hypothetical protein
MPPQRRPRPDIEQTREALREHDERAEQPPEVAHPADEDDDEKDDED